MKTLGMVTVTMTALLLLAGCAAAEPETAEQKDCAAAAPLLPELDKAQGGDLTDSEMSKLESKVTETINSSGGKDGQVGAMLFVLADPDDKATYYDFRAQLVDYCETIAKWPIE